MDGAEDAGPRSAKILVFHKPQRVNFGAYIYSF